MKQHLTIWNKERKRWMQSMQKDWQPIENKIYLHLNIFFPLISALEHISEFLSIGVLFLVHSLLLCRFLCSLFLSSFSRFSSFFLCVILVTFSWLFLVSVYFNLSPSHSWSLSHSLCAPFFSLSQIHSCYFFLGALQSHMLHVGFQLLCRCITSVQTIRYKNKSFSMMRISICQAINHPFAPLYLYVLLFLSVHTHLMCIFGYVQ